jgi:AAA+ superfamily predicted ATPase
VTASALISKWLGDSNKLIRAVFTLAHKLQPCIIFIGGWQAGAWLAAASDTPPAGSGDLMEVVWVTGLGDVPPGCGCTPGAAWRRL